MIQWILKEVRNKSYDLSSWRFLIYGSAPSSPTLIREAKNVLKIDLIQTYGLTEVTGGWVTFLTEKDHQTAFRERPELLTSVGRIGPHFECSIRDDSGRPLPHNERGEVWLRRTSVMKHYLNKPVETMREEGWLRSNDIGRLDQDGFLYLLDRKNFMIISGAVNVFPATVEAVLYEHPAVAEAAVVGAPHPEWGEAVVAFLKLAEGHESATAEALTQFCLTRLSKAETPKHFIFVDELPKTANAKISKHPLKRMLTDNPALLPWGGIG